MVKKVVIFFSFFALIVVGGSLIFSFWVLPKYAISDSSYDKPDGNARIIKPNSTEVVSSNDYGSGIGTRTNRALGITQIIIVFVAIYIVLLFGTLLKKRYIPHEPASIQTYLFKMSRLTGKSEYDIFYKAAEDWPVSGEQIEQDFRRYLTHQHIPYYVNNLVRKNRKHIDELRMPLFLESWYDEN